MKEDLYKNSKACEPSGLSPEAIRQYYWAQGFQMAKEIEFGGGMKNLKRYTFYSPDDAAACECTVKESVLGQWVKFSDISK
jgi:hypothetical protein